eukprot:GGOE01033479.1.p1 GENE.GGOE01033479.1~~GGOE01033479.1.p1  ORF type:complete len:556 (+),score=126.77 GGOE01033479.1:56-1669(+)
MWNAVQLFEPSPSSVPIIDSELKHYGRLWVPLTCVAPTKALARWLKGGKHQPALCAAYQFGQCLAGEGCAQAHVLVPFMTDVQRFLQERPFANCCFEHGDLASKRSDFQALLRRRRVELRTDAGVISIMPASLAVTAFFDTLAKEDPSSTAIITLDASKVCKLHQRQQCTYGADCRNVHLCRRFWGCVPADHKQVLESAPPCLAQPQLPVAAATVPVLLPAPKVALQCLSLGAKAPAVVIAPPYRTAFVPPPTPQSVSPKAAVCSAPALAPAPCPVVVVGPGNATGGFPPTIHTGLGATPNNAALPWDPRCGGYSGPPVMVVQPGRPALPLPTTGPLHVQVGTAAPLPVTVLPPKASPVLMTERPLSRLLEMACQGETPKSQKSRNKVAPRDSPQSPLPVVCAPSPIPVVVCPPLKKPLPLSPVLLAPRPAGDAVSQCRPDFSLFHHFPAQHSPTSPRPSGSSEGCAAVLDDILGSPTGFSEDDSLGYDAESLHSEEGGRPLTTETCQLWAADWLDAAAVGIHLPWAMVEELGEISP